MLITDAQQHSINLFFDFLKGQNKSPLTIKNYHADLISFFSWLGPSVRFPEINQQQIRNFIALSLSGGYLPKPKDSMSDLNILSPAHEPSSCNRRLATLRRFFDFLKYSEIIKIDPSKPVPFLPVPRRLPEFLSQEQTCRLLYYAKRESLFDYVIIHTLYVAALRSNELCQLERSAVDFSNNRILVHGKRQRDRYIPMLPHDLKPLSAFSKAHHHRFTFDRFLCTPQFKPLNTRYVHLRVTTIARLAGLDCHPHILRHSRATHLLQSGLELYYIKTILGHSTIQTTEIYAHVDDPHLRDAFTRASHSLNVIS